jgi:hypothetical protein
VGWRHRTYPKHHLEKANPPTQTPHTHPVGWLLIAISMPMLLNASPPYKSTFHYGISDKADGASPIPTRFTRKVEDLMLDIDQILNPNFQSLINITPIQPFQGL